MIETPHNFYAKSTRAKTIYFIKVGMLSLIVIAIIAFLAMITKTYWPALLFIAVYISIIAPFLDVPALKKKGKLVYYSPLFLAEKIKNDKIVIHGGTLFDYHFVIDRKLNGTQRKRIILLYYIKGLINLINDLQETGYKRLCIRGTSYIIGERTATKVGLRKTNTNFLQQLILVYNYFNLLIANSMAKAKLSFPNLRAINTYEGDLEILIARKNYIIKLKEKLENVISKSV